MTYMSKRSETADSKISSRYGKQVLGRSAATGVYVLKPKSKSGVTVSSSAIKAAVKTVSTSKK